MESWKRKLRMGMVGGGQGAFIGWVHRMAAALDQQVDFVAGCFSRDFDNTKTTGEQLYLDPARCYETYQNMAWCTLPRLRANFCLTYQKGSVISL